MFSKNSFEISCDSLDCSEENDPEGIKISVDIGYGTYRDLHITGEEDAVSLASAFAAKYYLSEEMQRELAEKIQEVLSFASFSRPGEIDVSKSTDTTRRKRSRQKTQKSIASPIHKVKKRMSTFSPKRSVSLLHNRTLSNSRISLGLERRPKKMDIFQSSTPYCSKIQLAVKSPNNSDMVSKARTENLLVAMKIRKYARVFKMLKPENGVINRRSIVSCDLPPDIRAAISPLLFQIAELDLKLNEKEFCDHLDLLMKELTLEERNHIMLVPKVKYKPPQYSFKPTINKTKKLKSIRKGKKKTKHNLK